MLHVFLCILWIFVSLFLVLIILLQRGKGGGLAGALGGAGGSSEFGTKAGDIFTRITVGVFGVWLLLAMILVWMLKAPARFKGATAAEAAAAAKEADADKAKKLDELLKSTGAGDKKDDPAKTPPIVSDADKKTEAKDDKSDPKKDAAKVEPSKDAPKADAAKTDVPKGDAPKSDAKPAPTTKDDKSAPPKSGDAGKKS